MELPSELKSSVEKLLQSEDYKTLKSDAENISIKYRTESGNSKRLVTHKSEAISYALVRMPATYGAVSTSLNNALQVYGNIQINTLIDAGAGTGTGTWAANEILNLSKITCLEREDAMLNIGSLLMKNSTNEVIKNVEWIKFDLVNDNYSEKADLVICSYVLNEMNVEQMDKVLKKLWDLTEKILLIIEPGTPVGFNEIMQIREKMIENGATIIAPCPHQQQCKVGENDWCHSTCRIARTKIHKDLKNGTVPYEDEKFSYMAISKEKINTKEYARVLRHPKIEPGKITLDVCKSNAEIEKYIITKKNKEMFKIARKIKCGDLFKFQKNHVNK